MSNMYFQVHAVKIRSSKNNVEMPQLRSFTLAIAWPIHGDLCATVYRVMAEKQLVLTILENRLTNNRGLDGML